MGLFEVSGIWMHAIGKTTIHSMWIGLLILGLLRLAQAYIPARLSSLRYAVSVSALLLLFSSCIVTFMILYEPLSPGAASISASGALPFESEKFKLVSSGESEINTSLIFTLFGYIYICGVLFMISRSVASVTSLRGLRNRGTQVASEWQLRFEGIGRSLGIKQKVDFLESARVKAPLLLGYLKPAVIVPAGMLSMLPVSQVEVILMHELLHLKRRDYLINIMQLFIESVLFYHPVVWIISGVIRSEREHCCDDGVLNATDNPVNYAKALVHIAEQQHFTRLTPGAVGSARQQFKSRIKRILNYNTMKTNMRDKVLALALLAGSLVLLLTVSGFTVGPGFLMISNISAEETLESAGLHQIVYPDTIPERSKDLKKEEARLEALQEIEEIDWESVKEEMEEARLEALKEIEEIDWESMKQEMEEARKEALKEIEEIDWESMKEEMEEGRLEALEEIEEIDWESMKEEMEEARLEALEEIEEIDWESMKEDIEKARLEAVAEIESIDWEDVRAEMEKSISEMKLDMEELKMEIENSMKGINWEKIGEDIEEELEKARQSLDSIKQDKDL